MGTRVISMESSVRGHAEALAKQDGILRRAGDLIEALQTRLASAEEIIQTQFKSMDARMRAYELAHAAQEAKSAGVGTEQINISSPGGERPAGDGPSIQGGVIHRAVPPREPVFSTQLPSNVHSFASPMLSAYR